MKTTLKAMEGKKSGGKGKGKSKDAHDEVETQVKEEQTSAPADDGRTQNPSLSCVVFGTETLARKVLSYL